MPGLGGKEELSDQQKTLLEFICKRFEASARLHKDLDPRFNTYYGLSRNYKRLRNRHSQATTPNDKDTVLQEFRRVWGDDLFVPYIFTVIETVLPGILSTDPTISVKPNQEAALPACDPVKRLFERDQKRMEYEMRLQETVRSGLRYGIGVQKLFWERRFRSGRKEIVPRQSQPGYQVRPAAGTPVYEGPMVESVDIFDFFWDPIGFNLDSCGYVIHRNWRSLEYIQDRVTEGKERRSKGEKGGWVELDMERIKGLASTTARGEVWAERMQAAGQRNFEGSEGNELFEVWEYHDRDNVYTVLGKELLVQEAENPFLHGDFPFQIFRPVVVEHEFVGIGEAEPISHLNFELNAMRGQRRDAATLSMNRGYFYSRGMLNPKNMVTGIGAMVPVDGPPGEVISPMPFTDLPASGVAEEEALKGDIELATGLSETALGMGGSETATATQLNLQVANKRIKQKTKNFHVETLRREIHQRLELYRQNITEQSQAQPLRIEPSSAPLSTPTGFSFVDCGPEQLNADIEVAPVDGSTEPESEAQKKADAVQEVDALTPFLEELDHRKVVSNLLRKLGHDEPESLLKPPGPDSQQSVMAIGQAMKQGGIPDEQIHQILEAAHQQITNPPLTEGPPGEGSSPEPEGAASQNGAAPEPQATGG